jgi:alginate O-acetyltransferase complex protein AlgF
MFRKQIATRYCSACAALMLLCSPAVHAQLYAKEAPPGSTFIHVFNATPNAGVSVGIGAKALPPLLPYSASDYIFLPPGEHVVQVGSQQKSFKLEGNRYYTVSADAAGLRLFELSEPLTRLKAILTLFNLLPGTTLALKTADGATSVLDAVAPNTSAQRAINPLTLSLALFSGEQKIASVPPITLVRGRSFSVFVSGSTTSPVLVVNED